MFLAVPIVSLIAGTGHPVTCNAAGSGLYTAPRVQLAPWVCSGLHSKSAWFQAQALVVTLHEAEHAKRLTDEHETQCAALAALPMVARLVLHATVKRQKQLALAAERFSQLAGPPYSGDC